MDLPPEATLDNTQLASAEDAADSTTPEAKELPEAEVSTLKTGWGRGKMGGLAAAFMTPAAKEAEEPGAEPEAKGASAIAGWGMFKPAGITSQEGSAEIDATKLTTAAEPSGMTPPPDPETPSAGPRHGWGLWKTAAGKMAKDKRIGKAVKMLVDMRAGRWKDKSDEVGGNPDNLGVMKLLRQVQSVKDIGPVTLKVMIAGASQLRKYGFNGTMNPYCTVEVPGKPETKWESKTVFNTYNPVWRQTHIVKDFYGRDSIKFAVMDYQKTHHPDTKKQETKRILVGIATLDADRFLGDKAASILGRCHGLDCCLKIEPSETGAYLKIRVFVQQACIKVDKPKPRQMKSKALPVERDEGLSPWQEHMASLSSTPRIVPGQVLVPTSKPVYKRLFGEQKEKHQRYVERIRKEIAHLEELDDERLLPFHHLKAESEEQIDSIVDRLYNDAGSRQSRLQVRIDQRMNDIDSQMGLKYFHTYANENIERDDTSVWERLVNYADVHKKKLEKKRADRDEAAERYMEENSIHANVDEDRDYDQVFGRLYTLHGKKLDRIKQTAKDEDKRWHDIIHHDSEEMLANKSVRGIKIAILGASGLTPEIAAKPPRTPNEGVPEPAPEASPLETKLPSESAPQAAPMATMAVDMNKDGVADTYITGVDLDRDGIPDIMQVTASCTTTKTASEAVEKKKQMKEAAMKDLLSRLRTAAHGVNLHKFFKRFDKDRSGEFDVGEMRGLIRKELRIRPDMVTDEDIEAFVMALDDDNSGSVSIDELVDFIERGTATLNSGPREQDREKMEMMKMEHGLGNFMGMVYCVCEFKAQNADLPPPVYNMETQRYTGDASFKIQTQLKRLQGEEANSVDWNEEHEVLAEFSDQHFLEFKIMQRAVESSLSKQQAANCLQDDILLGAMKIPGREFIEKGLEGEMELLSPEKFKALRAGNAEPTSTQGEDCQTGTAGLKRGGWGNKMGKKNKAKEAQARELKLKDLLSRLRTATTGMCLKKFFQRFDKDRSGTFDIDEFTRLIRVELRIRPDQVSDKDLAMLLDLLDDDHSGELAIDELVDFIENGFKEGVLEQEQAKKGNENDAKEQEQAKKRNENDAKENDGTQQEVKEREEKDEQEKKELEDKGKKDKGEKDKKEDLPLGKGGSSPSQQKRSMVGRVYDVGKGLVQPEEQGPAGSTTNTDPEEEQTQKPKAKKRGKKGSKEAPEEEEEAVEDATEEQPEEIPEEPKPAAKLKIKVYVLPPSKERALYVARSTERLYGHHILIEEKYQDRRRKQMEILQTKAARVPKPGTPQTPAQTPGTTGSTANSPEALNFGDRLYNDAHRRNADLRAKQRQAMENMHTTYEKDSVHSILNSRIWMMSDINNVFDRMYNPPPRAFNIKLGAYHSDLGEIDVSEDEAEFEGLQIEVEADAGAGVGKSKRLEDSPARGRRGAFFHNKPQETSFADEDDYIEPQDLDNTMPLSAYFTPDSGGRRSPQILRKANSGFSNASSPRRGASPQGSPSSHATGRNKEGRRQQSPDSSRSRGNTPQRQTPVQQRRFRQDSPSMRSAGGRDSPGTPATARRRQESPDSLPNVTPQADYFGSPAMTQFGSPSMTQFGSPAMTQFASPAMTQFSDWNSQGPSAPGSPRTPRATLEDVLKVDAAGRSRTSGSRSAPTSPAVQRRPSENKNLGRVSRASVAFNNGAVRSGQQSAPAGAMARQSLASQDARDYRASYVNGPSTPATSSRASGALAQAQSLGSLGDAQVRPSYAWRNANLDAGMASEPIGPGHAFSRPDGLRRTASSGGVGRLQVQSARGVSIVGEDFSKPPYGPTSARASTRASTTGGTEFAQSNSRPSSAGRVSSSKQLSFGEEEAMGNYATNSMNFPGDAGSGPQRKLSLPGQARSTPIKWKTAVNTVRAANAMSNLRAGKSGLKGDDVKWKNGPRVTITDVSDKQPERLMADAPARKSMAARVWNAGSSSLRPPPSADGPGSKSMPISSLRPSAGYSPSAEQPSPARLRQSNLLQPGWQPGMGETPSRRNSWGSQGGAPGGSSPSKRKSMAGRLSDALLPNNEGRSSKMGDEQQVRWK